MTNDLDSNTIRHLIFKGRVSAEQISMIARQVVDLAVKDALLSTAPDPAYAHPIMEKITAVVWELIIEGIYTPGISVQQPNLPFLRLTEHGKRCFEAGELTAHDPDDYLLRLRTLCPSIDALTLLYTGEALATFRIGRHLAATVMIGVAAENILQRLVGAVLGALNTPERQNKFDGATKGKKAKVQHDEVLKRLNSPASALPTELESVLTQHIDGIYDLIRRTRNDAGHPTGKLIGRDETHALLLLFPMYCKTAHDLLCWLGMNHI